MKRTYFPVVSLVVLGLMVVPLTAQPENLPAENHYLVYTLTEPVLFPSVGPLTLRDQWGSIDFDGDLMNYFWSNPLTIKNGEDVTYDPRVHQTWWSLGFGPIPTQRHEIVVGHQFGTFNFVVQDAVWLANPADKNDQIPPPIEWPIWANHYLCYMIVEGEPLNRTLVMDDQWGPHSNVALDPYCFCNPVEKVLPDGDTWPIVDAEAHLTCYWVNMIPASQQFYFDDQFVRNGYRVAGWERLICFPSTKDEALPAEETNWGRIKALFGDE